MESRSQYYEDIKAMEILERWGITSGRVLEIGAWNPISLSNSRLFIEAGFDAVLVEPSPKPLWDIVHEYPDRTHVLVLATPVTVTGGWLPLTLSDDALSGETVPEQWRNSGGHFGSAMFYSVSVKEFFAHYGGDFAVVSIDTEGSSLELFRAMVECGPRPRVVILEHDGRLIEAAPIYESANYRQVHLNGTNMILEWQGPKE